MRKKGENKVLRDKGGKNNGGGEKMYEAFNHNTASRLNIGRGGRVEKGGFTVSHTKREGSGRGGGKPAIWWGSPVVVIGDRKKGRGKGEHRTGSRCLGGGGRGCKPLESEKVRRPSCRPKVDLAGQGGEAP